MKFRPLHDRVLLKPLPEDDKTTGGIIIPDTAKEKPAQAEVIAVGPGLPDEKGKVQPLDVKAGDRVLYAKFAGTEVKMQGDDHLIIREADLLAIVEGAASGKGAKNAKKKHAA